MSSRREKNDGRDIFSKNKIRIKRTIKEKDKLIIRMIGYHATQYFVSNSSDTFEFIFEEKPSIDRYFQNYGLNKRMIEISNVKSIFLLTKKNKKITR